MDNLVNFADAVRSSIQRGEGAGKDIPGVIQLADGTGKGNIPKQTFTPSRRTEAPPAQHAKVSASINTVSKVWFWQPSEDRELKKYVHKFGGKRWKAVASNIPGRTHIQCLQRWKRLKQAETNRRPTVQKKGRTVPREWTKIEDEALRRAVDTYGPKGWKTIAQMVSGRNGVQCSHRWNKVLAPGLTKGKWTAEEDGLLTKLYSCQAGVVFEEFASNAQGEVRGGLRVIDSQTAKSIQSSINWRSIATKITGRNAKQCRERWCNYLDPSLKCGNWTKKEDRQLMALVKKKSKKWSAVASEIEGRTENAVKVRWNQLSRLKRK